MSLQRELARLDTLVDTNSVVTQRLAASQSALATMAEAGAAGAQHLVTFKGNDAADQLAIQKTEIQSAMSAFSSGGEPCPSTANFSLPASTPT